MIRDLALGIAISAAPAFARAAPAQSAPPPSAEAPTSVDDGQAAIDRAKQAARAGDHRTALAEFETAMRLRPSARLQFNVAVCHHQLMLAEAAGSAAHEEHRAGAVAAYREYLRGTPDADDRTAVERIIVELGGEPPRPGIKLPRIDPDDAPAAPRLQDADIPRIHPDDPPTPPTTPPDPAPEPLSKPAEPRARVGPFIPLVLAHMGQLADTERVAFLPLVGLGARGAALLGSRRRVHLGAELAFYLQPTGTRSRHSLLAAHLAAAADYAVPLGSARRFELAFGGTLGFLYEQLRSRDTTSTTCPKEASGEVSSRGGLLLGGRIGLLVLLGPRRNHELALRFGPALAVTGSGSRGKEGVDGNTAEDCDRPPFEQVGLGGRAGLVTMIDLGYAPRF